MNNKNNIVIGIVIALVVIVAGYFYYAAQKPVASPATTASSSPSAITIDDNDETVTFNRGDRFALSLGELEWSLSFSTPNIVNRVKNIAVMRGSQGVYTADNAGTTILTAEGRPNCVAGQMCAQYIVEFKTTIVVR